MKGSRRKHKKRLNRMKTLVKKQFAKSTKGIRPKLPKKSTEEACPKNHSISFSSDVLDAFRNHVGKLRPETGGLLGSTKDKKVIDKEYFDKNSNNTGGSFYYDVESMSKVYRDWKAKGYITNGIFHSHPMGAIRPSYHDVSTALLHIEFFGIDYFYLPIIQPRWNGEYKLFFYVVRLKGDELEVTLEYVLKALQEGYEYVPYPEWSLSYSIKELREYREHIDRHEEQEGAQEHKDMDDRKDMEECKDTDVSKDTEVSKMPIKKDYFEKVRGLYPEHVLEKVIVCVGTGGARSFLENMARSGFKNFVLIDADVVSPSNIATQGVYISEMGKKKVAVLRDRILDINPDAEVVCVDRFLDDEMSDEEFLSFLNGFGPKKPKDYLILGCTDNFEAQKRSSLLALKYGMPYLAAMMYEAGAAAELIFIYPGVTESCPRCLLRDRFEKYENGFVNDVDSSSCTIFATERMNALKGYIALMLLMYQEAPGSIFSSMLDEVKNRNFVEIRLHPYLKDTKLGIGLFDRVFESASRYTFMDETIWIPQHPDSPKYGEKACRLCGGSGDLRDLSNKWEHTDTRTIRFDESESNEGEADKMPKEEVHHD